MSGNATGNEPDKETALPARGEGTEAQADGAVESRAQGTHILIHASDMATDHVPTVTTAPGDEEAREKSQDEKDQRAMELGGRNTAVDVSSFTDMFDSERHYYRRACLVSHERGRA